MKLIEHLGMQYPDKGGKHKYKYAIYECPVCLNHFKVNVASVKRGDSTKCRSCQVSEKNRVHGMRTHPLYMRHLSMMQRCYTESDAGFANYGGRGIRVSSDLKNINDYIDYVSTLENFNVKGFTVDRIDNERNYEKGNLRWVSVTYQNTNQRKKKTSKFKYIGVYRIDTPTEQYGFRIRVAGKRVYRSGFATQEDAAVARDTYIINNNLQHVLTGVTI